MSAPLSAPLGQRATPSAPLSGLNSHVGSSVCSWGENENLPSLVCSQFARMGLNRYGIVVVVTEKNAHRRAFLVR